MYVTRSGYFAGDLAREGIWPGNCITSGYREMRLGTFHAWHSGVVPRCTGPQ